MKNIIVIAGGSVASFVVLLLLGMGLLYMKPELFGSMPQETQTVADSAKVKPDSLAKVTSDTAQVTEAAKPQEQAPLAGPDTVLVAKLTERARTLETIVDSLKKNIQASRVKSDSLPQSDWKSTARLIESMTPEEAGKILKQMSDTEVKQVITKVKTKQAGKILAMLDPERVARILR